MEDYPYKWVLELFFAFMAIAVLGFVGVIYVLNEYGAFDPFNGIHPFTEEGRRRTQALTRRNCAIRDEQNRERDRLWREQQHMDRVTDAHQGAQNIDMCLGDKDGDIFDETTRFSFSQRIARLELHLQKLEETVSPKSALKRG
jgi:hypothetical protein